MNINDVIIRPYISEKSSKGVDNKIYFLEVDRRATKLDVKKAVELIFSKDKAKVEKVRIMNVKPKYKKMGKFEGSTSGYKKAIVYLESGLIPIYGATDGVENIEETKKKKGLQIINTEKIMAEAEKKEQQ